MRFATLLVLVIDCGKPLSRSALAEMLWPDVPGAQARHSLRHVTYVLRKMGAGIADSPSYLELRPTDVAIDYEEALARERVKPDELQQFLPTYNPTFSPPFAEWVDAQRSHVHARIRARLLTLLAEVRATGRWSDVEDVARQCLLFDPLNEEATLAFAEATALNGSKASAVAILDRYLADLNSAPREIRAPATLLRKRIAERLSSPYSASAEACFVGRELTLAMLTGHLRRAETGKGSGCFLWGPAGMGKTRVVLEATKVAMLEGVRVRKTECQVSELRRPLSVFADLVPSILELPGSLGCSPRSRQFLSRITSSGSDAPALEQAIGAVAPDAPFVFANVRQSILDLIDAVCDEAPLLIVIEDAHWIDEMSASIVCDLIRRSATRSLCLVLTSRDPPVLGTPLHEISQRLTIHQVPPLSDDDATRLFSTLAAVFDKTPDPRLVRRNVALAGGNPFFVRELAAHWAKSGGGDQLPPSLVAALRERVDRIEPPAIRVLQVCALLGKNSTLARIDRVLLYPRLQLINCLQALDCGDLVTCAGDQVLVKHDLLCETAIGLLSVTARKYLHRQIGITLEADVTPMQSGLAWDCAYHLRQAGEDGRAFSMLLRCARQAVELGSPKDAIEILEAVYPICGSDEQRLQVRTDLVAALRWAGSWGRIIELQRELASLNHAATGRARHHDDNELAILEALWETERKVPASLNRALACLRAQDASPSHRIRAGIWALIFAHNFPDAEVAENVYRTLTSVAAVSATRESDSLTADLIYHTAFGDLVLGAGSGSRLVAIARNAGDVASLSRVLRLAAVPLLYLGRYLEARSLLNEGLEIVERSGLRWATFITTAFVVRSYFEEGDLAHANQWYERLRQLAESPSNLASTYAAHLLGAKIALVESRYEAPELVDFPPWQRWEEIASIRAQSIAFAVCALGSLRRGLATQHADVVGRFEIAFKRAKGSGDQDFAAFALFESLCAAGEHNRAASELRLYIECDRRERSPFPPYLARPLEICRSTSSRIVRS